MRGAKKIAASNNGFDEKLKCYDGRGHHLKSDSKVTSFTITQQIVNDDKAGEFGKKWNIEALESWWKWFCDQVSEILI